MFKVSETEGNLQHYAKQSSPEFNEKGKKLDYLAGGRVALSYCKILLKLKVFVHLKGMFHLCGVAVLHSVCH